MLEFTRVLNTGEEGYLYFTFNGILSSGKLKYQVTVKTRGPQELHFMMEQKKERWKIVDAPKPPDWILALEPDLEKIIREKRWMGNLTKNMNVA